MINALRSWNSKLENAPKALPESLAFFLYLCINLVVGFFHEPFFDEAIAWEIARHCSLRDLIFYVPHYEGHPPLWHLLLAPFAKAGAPYELTLTLVSLLFTGTSMYLLLFRGTFPRLVKLLLPFTFFLCYQHSVISRPYCMMMLAFVLLAIRYPSKGEHPVRFTLCLGFLCLTSAYGIVLAGSLAFLWILECWNGERLTAFLRRLLRSKIFVCLAGLLLWAILLMAQIMPRSDTFLDAIPITVHFPRRLLYTLLALPADATCIQVFYYNTLLRTTILDPYVLGSGCVLGGLILFLCFLYARRKGTLLLLFVPYGLFGVFAASVYMNMHHMGIILFYLLFWLWVSCGREDVRAPLRVENELLEKWLRILSRCVLVYMMFVSLWWTCCSCIGDIRYPYSNGREMAAFIRENHLEQYQIMAEWTKWIVRDPDGNPLKLEDIHHSIVYPILPYLEENIFCNGPFGMDGNYAIHKVPTGEEIQESFSRCRALGAPDVLIGTPDLEIIYEGAVTMEDYCPVWRETYQRFWKSESYRGTETIYVRKELAEELGLTVLPEEENPFVF